MRIIEYPDVKQIIVCGDIHGNFNGIVFKLCVQYACTDTLLIVAGDCGFGFHNPGYYEQIYDSVAGRLRKANNFVAFVRGNHDDPAYFDEEKVSYKRWRTVPDYSVIRACGHNVLCIGGGISIDRLPRQQENARMRAMGHFQTAVWWSGEAPVFNPEAIDHLPVGIQVDTVVTHSAPSFCQLNSKRGLRSWAEKDPRLIDDIDAERRTLDEIQKCLLRNGHPVKWWFDGHFHQSWSALIEGIRYCMLDIEEFREIPEYDNHLTFLR